MKLSTENVISLTWLALAALAGAGRFYILESRSAEQQEVLKVVANELRDVSVRLKLLEERVSYGRR